MAETDLPAARRPPLLVAIVLAQAVLVGLVLQGGWFSGPDLANVSFAHGKTLDWDYLSASLGGHFGAAPRLGYWLLERTTPLGWGVTVAIRLLLQALATVLLWRLLEQLVGPRRWIPLVVGLYAVNPLLVPGTAVLASGFGLTLGQACLLGALLTHVRYTRDGRLRDAALTAVLVLVMLVYDDQAAPGIALLPLLSLVFLSRGSVVDRVRSVLRRWPGWAMLGAGLGAFAAAYLSGSYTGASRSLDAAGAWDVVRTEWTDVLGIALVGGPWRWGTIPDDWVSVAYPPLTAKVLGQVLLLILVVWSLRRTGARALLAWAIPVGLTIGGALLVAVGRFDDLGTFIAPILRYSHLTPLGLALGATLAFARTPDEGVTEQVRRPTRALAPVLAVGALAVAVASAVSTIGFADRFWQNPSRAYVENLAASARSAEPTTEVYDSVVPAGVIPPLEPNHFVSDILVLTGTSLKVSGNAPSPKIVDAHGRLVAAGFLPVADIADPLTPGCGIAVHGAGSRTIALQPVATSNDWFLELQLYQQHPSSFRIEVRDVGGEVLPVSSGSSAVVAADRLVRADRRLRRGIPATLTVTTDDPATNFCLVHAYVGGPFPR